MRTEPRDLERAELGALLQTQWAIRATSVDYLPVGFGSHHWHGVDAHGARRFVTAHDLRASAWLGDDPDAAFAALERAYATAAAVRDEAGLEFVVAPLLDRAGSRTRRLGDRYAVAVFPFLVGVRAEDGLLDLVERLHEATELVPPGLPRREDFAIQNRESLLRALGDLDRPWTAGPFAEPARELLSRSASNVARRLERHDELAGQVRAASTPWVVTHGEPHSANVIRDGRGALHLVDWDTVKLAPRERDLWMLPDSDADPAALRLYRCRWDLADIAEYVDRFRRPHERTADTVESWGYLVGYLGQG